MSIVSSSTPGEAGLLASLRVLVVEDDDDSRDYFAFVLERRGATVKAVGTAAEALAALDEPCPDVLVSDIGLPGEDGCELMRRVRRLENERAGVPAAAVTAFADPSMRARVFEAGFQAHVSKPVSPERLVAVVAGLAERVESLRLLSIEIEARFAENRIELERMRRAVEEGKRLAAESYRLREQSRALREGRLPEH
jgi:CheY-like chemotaxis protein